MSMLTLLNNPGDIVSTGQLVYPAEDVRALRSLLDTVFELKTRLASADREIKQEKMKSSEKGFKEGLKRGRRIARIKVSRVLLALEKERVEQIKKNHEQCIRLSIDIVRNIGLSVPTEATLIELAIKSAEELRVGEKASLCVNPDLVEVVTTRLQQVRNIDWLLRVESDETLEPQDCLLKTEYGLLRIGLESQLRLIERRLYEPSS